jgi:hypothetical protein
MVMVEKERTEMKNLYVDLKAREKDIKNNTYKNLTRLMSIKDDRDENNEFAEINEFLF